MSQLIYYMYAGLFMIGLYGIIISKNLLRKLIGLNITQTAVILLYVAVGYKAGNFTTPIYTQSEGYINPVPHVLMLTAIVVGISVTSLALALLLKIKDKFGTIEEDEIQKIIEENE